MHGDRERVEMRVTGSAHRYLKGARSDDRNGSTGRGQQPSSMKTLQCTHSTSAARAQSNKKTPVTFPACACFSVSMEYGHNRKRPGLGPVREIDRAVSSANGRLQRP